MLSKFFDKFNPLYEFNFPACKMLKTESADIKKINAAIEITASLVLFLTAIVMDSEYTIKIILCKGNIINPIMTVL